MVKPKDFFKRPPGPQAGMWSWKHLNIWKTFRLITSKRVRGFYEAFPSAVPVGSAFPETVLTATDGSTFNTKELVGRKHLVLFTGAIT